MNITDRNENIKPWHKEHYVWLIIFFPMLAVIGGIITLFLAVQSNDGLVVDDYYKQGLEINRVLERDQIATHYQLNAEIKLDRAFEEVFIEFSATSDFIFPASIQASFLHATRSGLDKDVNLLLAGENTYRGNLPALEPGKWYVHIQQDDWRLVNIVNVSR